MPKRRFPSGPSMLAAMRGLQSARGGRNFSGLSAFLARMAQRYGGITHWTLLGQHFFFLKTGPRHLRTRRLLQPAFHREMTLLTLAVAAQTLFSTNVGDQAEAPSAALTAALRAFPAAMSRLGQLSPCGRRRRSAYG